MLTVVALVVLYYVVVIKGRHRFKDWEPATTREKVAFISSMILLYVVKGSPLDLLGHILFSVHMAQMALLLLAVAPLLLIGIPNWIWRRVLATKGVGSFIRLMTKPVISLLVFSLMFSLYHYPYILDTVKLSIPLHAPFTMTLFLAALFLWWPIVHTVEGEPKLHGLKKILYVVLSAILITPACTLIIFVDVPVYATYQSGEAWLQAMALCVPGGTLASLPPTINGPELFTNIPVLYDQQLGGIIMKIMQELIYVFVIGRVFFVWYRDEQLRADEITMDDLANRREMDRMMER